jgi:hypothetical protein
VTGFGDSAIDKKVTCGQKLNEDQFSNLGRIGVKPCPPVPVTGPKFLKITPLLNWLARYLLAMANCTLPSDSGLINTPR